MTEFRIACPQRRDALADAYATAQLLLVLFAEAERQGAGTVGKLRRLDRNHLAAAKRSLAAVRLAVLGVRMTLDM